MSQNNSVISRRGFLIGGAGVMAAGILNTNPAGSNAQTTGYENDSTEQHIDMATWYEVDARWPEKPANITWGHVPGVILDRQENVWIFTHNEPMIQAYDPKGRMIHAWGTKEQIAEAHYMKFDSQANIWAADTGKHVISQFTKEGKLLKTIGVPGQTGNDEKHFNMPTDIIFNQAGEMFITDGYGNRRVVHLDANGKFIKSWGTDGVAAGQFKLPHAIIMDSAGLLYVSDRDNARVQVFDQSGKFLSQWAGIMIPWGFWISDRDEIWVCGSSPMRWQKDQGHLGCPPKDQLIAKFDTHGKMLQLWTMPKCADGKEKPGELNWVHGIALDKQGNLYLGDINGQRLQKFIRKTHPMSLRS